MVHEGGLPPPTMVISRCPQNVFACKKTECVRITSNTHVHTREGGGEEEDIHHNHLAKMLKSPQPRSFERETPRHVLKSQLYTLMKADGNGHFTRVVYVEETLQLQFQ